MFLTPIQVQNALYSLIEIKNSAGDVTVGTVTEFITDLTKTRFAVLR